MLPFTSGTLLPLSDSILSLVGLLGNLSGRPDGCALTGGTCVPKSAALGLIHHLSLGIVNSAKRLVLVVFDQCLDVLLVCLGRLVGLLVGEELLAGRGIEILRRLRNSCCNRPLFDLLLLLHVDLRDLLQDCLLHSGVHVFKPLVSVEVNCARQAGPILGCLQMNV